MSDSDLTFGIIGCGKIAHRHAAALRELPGVQLVGVCDTVPERAAAFGAQYGARSYTEVDEFLAGSGVDVVSICTPSGLHAALAVKVAKGGKHILVEKPLALTVADCQKAIGAAGSAGVRLAVVHPNRFLPNVMALRRAVEKGAFGRLSHGAAVVRWFRPPEYYAGAPWRGTHAMDGGVLFNQAIHDIDLLQWMFGPVAVVTGFTATRLRAIESEDVGAAVVRFESGALGVIEASATIYPENLEETLAVFGEKGTAVIGGRTIGQGVQAWRFADSTVAVPETAAVPPHWGHLRVIADLVAFLRDGRAPAVDGEEATKAVGLVQAIYQADQMFHGVEDGAAAGDGVVKADKSS